MKDLGLALDRPPQGHGDILVIITERAQVRVALLVRVSCQLAEFFLLPFCVSIRRPLMGNMGIL